MAKDEKPEDLFSDVEELEPEILVGPTLDEKLDQIIDLLKKHQKEHDEIRGELKEIKHNQKVLSSNQDALASAYKNHGLQLGKLLEQCDERHAPEPLRLAAEIASLDPKGNGDDR